jgi:peptide/nickel transport system permease protein
MVTLANPRVRRLASRLGSSVVTVFGASIIAFVLLRVLPGDPARVVLGNLASPAAIAAERNVLGLDRPLPVQYGHFIGALFRGDWGFSFVLGQPVRSLILGRLPASLELGFYALVFALVATGILALLAVYRRGWVDRVVRGLSFLGLGTPSFWLGIVLLLVFSLHLRWLPGPEGRLGITDQPPRHVTGFYTIDALLSGRLGTFVHALKHLLLPALTLAFAPFAFLVRLLRGNLLEVSREPFLTVSRGKGLTRWGALWRHALPNGLLPTLTAGGLVFAEFFGGSVLVERVFSWPGVGNLIADAIQKKDFGVVQAFILLSAVVYVGVNFIVDALYTTIDPRTGLEAGAA